VSERNFYASPNIAISYARADHWRIYVWKMQLETGIVYFEVFAYFLVRDYSE
jgi:hypothetical protein